MRRHGIEAAVTQTHSGQDQETRDVYKRQAALMAVRDAQIAVCAVIGIQPLGDGTQVGKVMRAQAADEAGRAGSLIWPGMARWRA